MIDHDEDELQAEASQQQDKDDEQAAPTRSSSRSNKGQFSYQKMNLFHHQCHLQTQSVPKLEYKPDEALVIAKIMDHYNHLMLPDHPKHQSFMQTMSIGKATKKYVSALGEMRQQHDRKAFTPIHVHELTPLEKKRAMESILFLVEKRDGTLKARSVANGSTQRAYISKEDAASPTVMVESIFITAAIDALEGRDVMISDVPNAFVQTKIT